MPETTRVCLLASCLLVSALSTGGARATAPSAATTEPVAAVPAPSALPEGWQHGAFAEIYVRGYRDSDGDGIGDLRGLIAQLDYLQALGVRGIWLMPITRSGDRDHGYAVEDYRGIEPAYGSLADFDVLIAQAHARGIGVIIDYVINHSASSHPLFQAGAMDHASPYRKWYVWRKPAPAGWSIFDKDPWVPTATGAYLAQFSPSMPDFDLQAPGVMAWHEDNLRFWLNRGVDGFRFDAVAHLVEHGPDAWRDQPQNFRLVHRLAQVVAAYPRRYVVCEATRRTAEYAAPDACGSAFAFELAPLAIAAARGERQSIRKLARHFERMPPTMATMLANHDLFAGDRLWNQLAGNEAQYRLAAASYLLAPGSPFIYYGEEIGMSAVTSLQGDARLRTPMSWSGGGNAGFGAGVPFRPLSPNTDTHNVEAQSERPDSLLAWYRALLALRNGVPALARGSYEQARVDGATWHYRRRLGDQGALVLINYGRRAQEIAIGDLPRNTNWHRALPATGPELAVDADGGFRVRMPAKSVVVFLNDAAP